MNHISLCRIGRGVPQLTIAFIMAGAIAILAQQPASFDPAFNPESIYGNINAIALQPDGRILVGSDFIQILESPYIGLARLNDNGSLDPSFKPEIQQSASLSNSVASILVQDDGNILIGGLFALYYTNYPTLMARLKPDGTLDPSFQPLATTNTARAMRTMALQPDGKIVVAVPITHKFPVSHDVDGVVIKRLTKDGAVDASFGEPVNGDYGFSYGGDCYNDSIGCIVSQITIMSDGDLMVFGNRPLLKLDPSGHPRSTFKSPLVPYQSHPGLPSPPSYSSVRQAFVQPDGNMIISGTFLVASRVYGNWWTWDSCAGLNADGTFNPGFLAEAVAVCQLADGSFLTSDDARSRLMDRNGLLLDSWQGPSLNLALEQPDGKILAVQQQNATTVPPRTCSIFRLSARDMSPQPPAIIEGPVRKILKSTKTVDYTVLYVRCTGYPLSYQWWRDGAALPGATNSTLDATGVQGRFSVIVSNELNAVKSSEVAIIPATMDFVLNTPGWSYSYSTWYMDFTDSHDGVASAVGKCAFIGAAGYADATITTSLSGPGLLSFWSMGPNQVFRVDDLVYWKQIGGIRNWQENIFWIPEGSHRLFWIDPSMPIVGPSDLYLDEVKWVPASTNLLDAALSTDYMAGQGFTFRLEIGATNEGCSCQWYYAPKYELGIITNTQYYSPAFGPEGSGNFSRIPGATNRLLLVPQTSLTNAGFYFASVSNGSETAFSPVIHLEENNKPYLWLGLHRSTPTASGQIATALEIKGLPNKKHIIQLSNDMIRWTDWISITGDALLDISWMFQSGSISTRFFRAVDP